jgi:hypothetical protein
MELSRWFWHDGRLPLEWKCEEFEVEVKDAYEEERNCEDNRFGEGCC